MLVFRWETHDDNNHVESVCQTLSDGAAGKYASARRGVNMGDGWIGSVPPHGRVSGSADGGRVPRAKSCSIVLDARLRPCHG